MKPNACVNAMKVVGERFRSIIMGKLEEQELTVGGGCGQNITSISYNQYLQGFTQESIYLRKRM